MLSLVMKETLLLECLVIRVYFCVQHAGSKPFIFHQKRGRNLLSAGEPPGFKHTSEREVAGSKDIQSQWPEALKALCF